MRLRTTINSTPEIRTLLNIIVAEHEPYVSRHLVLRTAVLVGLEALADDVGLLAKVLWAQRARQFTEVRRAEREQPTANT